MCEYVGARFSLSTGFSAKETREQSEPVPRVTVNGDLPGGHHILLDIIPRSAASYGTDLAPAALAKVYFERVRASFGANWTDLQTGQYPGPKRSYPAFSSVERFNTNGIPGQYDHTILLYFPDGLRPDGYFFSFFWTDIHLAGTQRAPVIELQNLVDSFVILGSPLGAASRGCG